MKTNPFFSVLIDSYNYGAFIEEAVESVLNQNFPKCEVEIIVVDDGSTDDTPERMRRYKDKVRYIRKQNGGQASAFNTGIRNSRGAVIAFLDADDYWHPSKLELVASACDDDRVDFVYHYMNVVSNGRIIDRYLFPDPLPDKYTDETYLQLYLRGSLPWFSPSSGMTVRRECLLKTVPLPEEEMIGADLYLHYLLPLHMRELRLIKKSLGYYRLHGDNLSGGNLLTAEKMQRETRILSNIKTHVGAKVLELGYDSELLLKRIEASIIAYGIIRDCMRGRKNKALSGILHNRYFLAEDPLIHKISRKAALLTYLLFPPSFCLWLQRKSRSVRFLMGRFKERHECRESGLH